MDSPDAMRSIERDRDLARDQDLPAPLPPAALRSAASAFAKRGGQVGARGPQSGREPEHERGENGDRGGEREEPEIEIDLLPSHHESLDVRRKTAPQQINPYPGEGNRDESASEGQKEVLGQKLPDDSRIVPRRALAGATALSRNRRRARGGDSRR